MSKKKNERKRLNVLSIELDESHINPESGIVELNLKFDGINNELRAFQSNNQKEIISQKQVHAYFGEKKIRVLSEIPKDASDNSLDLNKKLKRYNSILAIDTNTKIIKGETYSIGYSCQLTHKINNDKIIWTLHPVQVFIIIGKGEKYENRNWVSLVKYLQSHKAHNLNHKIGIIVDSDLGEIGDYNKGLKPVFDDFILPEQFEFIYASDKASDNVLNDSIRHCHKVAKLLLDNLDEEINKST